MEIIARNYSSFLKIAQEQPILSLNDERFYFAQYQKYNDKQAFQKIIYAHLRLVAKIVRDFRALFHDLLELAQQGTIGLLKAATKYIYKDATARFSTYAEPWIRGEISSFLSQYLPDKGGTISLDEYDFDIIDEEVDMTTSMENNQYIARALDSLDKREKQIIVNRYFSDPPLLRDTLAEHLNISTERVRQIENKALIKLKQYLDFNKTSIMIEEIKKS